MFLGALLRTGGDRLRLRRREFAQIGSSEAFGCLQLVGINAVAEATVFDHSLAKRLDDQRAHMHHHPLARHGCAGL
jgi:hypothetical protein